MKNSTILLTESGDLEVYEGKEPEISSMPKTLERTIEIIQYKNWLSTKKVVKMAEGELERLVDHLDLWNKEIESPVDVSDIVTLKPFKNQDIFSSEGIIFLGYFTPPPVDKEEETQEDVRMKVIKECQEELLKHLFPVTHLNGYPIEAVPKATILELDKLLKFKRR